MLLLAPVTDPAAIPHALASALNLQVVQGDVLAACVALLGDRSGLLVVDNCEHLLDAARDAVRRPALGLPAAVGAGHQPRAARRWPRSTPSGWHRSRCPGAEQDPRGSPSVAVFLDRARRVRPGPPPTPAELRLVADIVRRLDGLPLAIELAAGRLSGLLPRRPAPPARPRPRPARRPDRRRRPAPDAARHRRVVLPAARCDDEQRLFRYLSVFVDGIALDDAERLAADLGLAGDPGTVLSRLVDTSMVDAEFAGGGTRYRMLETLRAFGLDRLAAAGEDDDAGDRLLRWAVELTAWFARRVAHRARARGGRGAAPGAGEPAGGVAAGPQPEGTSTRPPR